MKIVKKLPLSAAVLLLISCLCMAGIHMYRETLFSYVGPLRLEKPVTRLDLSNAPVDYIEDIAVLSDLQELNLRGTGLTVAEYEYLSGKLPGCRIFWDVPFQGGFYPESTEHIRLSTLTEADIATLDYLPNLKYIDATDCTDYSLLAALAQHRPDCHVDYAIVIDGVSYSLDTTEATFPGELCGMLPDYLGYLPELRQVVITEPLGNTESLLALEKTFPQVRFSWSFTFRDMLLEKDTTTTLDLTNLGVSVEEMEELILLLPNLTYVDMTDCGVPDEDMDALNRRHENIKIVWTVNLGPHYRVRTDATFFFAGLTRSAFDGTKDYSNLRYCTDMVCVDLGHMDITDCEWARYMPKLKYLILADTPISDISPLAGLQELIYLEIFMTNITDYSPLLELPALEDLNLNHTKGDPEVIRQLTWVKNIWWFTYTLSRAQRQDLLDSLPDTHIQFWSFNSTGFGWRKLPNYYAQRDYMGMYYMD